MNRFPEKKLRQHQYSDLYQKIDGTGDRVQAPAGTCII